MKTIFSIPYFGSIYFYSLILKEKDFEFEINENFVKQTWRSRCRLLSPNGILNMVIPVLNRDKKQIIKDVKICNNKDWKNIHFKTIESCYRSSAYFEYFEDDFVNFYLNKYTFLIDVNIKSFELINNILKLNLKYNFTEIYTRNVFKDFRNENYDDNNFKINNYNQVFKNKFEFKNNLSILDIIFNMGKETINYLN